MFISSLTYFYGIPLCISLVLLHNLSLNTLSYVFCRSINIKFRSFCFSPYFFNSFPFSVQVAYPSLSYLAWIQTTSWNGLFPYFCYPRSVPKPSLSVILTLLLCIFYSPKCHLSFICIQKPPLSKLQYPLILMHLPYQVLYRSTPSLPSTSQTSTGTQSPLLYHFSFLLRSQRFLLYELLALNVYLIFLSHCHCLSQFVLIEVTMPPLCDVFLFRRIVSSLSFPMLFLFWVTSLSFQYLQFFV